MSKKNIKEWSKVLKDNNYGILELKLKDYLYIANNCIDNLDEKEYFKISPEDTESNGQFDKLYELYLDDISEGLLCLLPEEVSNIIIPNIKCLDSHFERQMFYSNNHPKDLLTKSLVELTMRKRTI